MSRHKHTHSQGLNVGKFGDVPHFDAAVLGAAVEGASLQNEALWCGVIW